MEHVAAGAIIDPQGVLTAWSEGARQLLGYAPGQVIGSLAKEMLAEEPAASSLAALSGPVALRHQNGDIVRVTLVASPVTGARDEPLGFLVSATLITDFDHALAARVFQQASVAMSAFDPQQRYLLLNNAACQVMGMSAGELLGRFYTDSVPVDSISEALQRNLRAVAHTGKPISFDSHARGPAEGPEKAWSVDLWPVLSAAGELDAVGIAAFDRTEQYWLRRRMALLNTAANHIGSTLDVPRTAQELTEVAVPGFADFASVDLLEWVLGADEPVTAFGDGIVLCRIAYTSAVEDAPSPGLVKGAKNIHPPFSPPARALMDGRAVLRQAEDPEFKRWIQDRNRQDPGGRKFRASVRSMLAVPLQARGTTLGVAMFSRIQHPEAYDDDDIALAEELASRAAVCVDNARRFARERSTALALQHSLLPRRLPTQSAVEVAHRYLPSKSTAGIGGDWFDVIPLSGGRVALVVGDVVGHGLQSSATMGRLRTAVRTLADVDLPSDELLTHLDDLVTHLAADERSTEVAEQGATCLYAVYDPISRHLTMASAGHPAPAVVTPDGKAWLVEMTAGPPLGVGGLPFETAEIQLPEGSRVALYTDGLIENRHRDLDDASAELCRLLALPADSLDAVCDTVLKSLLPNQPTDDVALLLACTRGLGEDHVATWDIPPEPAQVAGARQAVIEQLTTWGLNELSFVTELVISELVTNAIRYGEPPIRLRLIRDRALICEVADGSSTSPHLRRAHAFDEGGRGLLLVAQLTDRWGSRLTGTGKTIWAEQRLPST
ncbi:SpoIIE family protein phosphatase [Streptomyces chartreusis]|uniref:SpoIIE family protein phosphatase n=1 Tax=Streptomyces TaxID=1883 RepID=UPI00055B4646|nr:SpoIIE family protein phosphatase [Streptomyces sp. HGB0020]